MWVLVVDDSRSNAIFVSEALKLLGHRSLTSHDPVSALALLDQMTFDCVLVDWHMPVLDGMTFLSEVRTRATSTKKAPPVLLMTADPSPDAGAEATRRGAAGILYKPLDTHLLESALADACPIE